MLSWNTWQGISFKNLINSLVVRIISGCVFRSSGKYKCGFNPSCVYPLPKCVHKTNKDYLTTPYLKPPNLKWYEVDGVKVLAQLYTV